MYRIARQFLPVLVLIPLLAGCQQMQNIRIAQDAPEDLGTLLENHEYARARLLTGKHPQIDTSEVQTTIIALESAYENSVYAEASSLEAADDLLGAVQLLSDAIQKVPHSTSLRELRYRLEQERVHQLKIHERNTLITRANYLLDQQQLYRQQVNLQPPSNAQRSENSRNESEATLLAGQLLEHARYALQIDDLDTAKNCLQLSERLDESGAASALLAEMREKELLAEKTTQQTASKKEAIIIRDRTRDDKKQTEQLLAEIRQALEDNNLHVARAALAKIPSSASKDSEVLALRDNYEQVVRTRVNDLLLKGDKLYRADIILAALKQWTEALSLDPENREVRERIERANKVLAKLEELKRQQQK
jgi:tetratricopeptide (TPR) repeat protein